MIIFIMNANAVIKTALCKWMHIVLDGLMVHTTWTWSKSLNKQLLKQMAVKCGGPNNLQPKTLSDISCNVASFCQSLLWRFRSATPLGWFGCLLRFSAIPKTRPAPQAAPQVRLRMQQEQQASTKNRRLAQQMANRPAVQAALKLKKVRYVYM